MKINRQSYKSYSNENKKLEIKEDGEIEIGEIIN